MTSPAVTFLARVKELEEKATPGPWIFDTFANENMSEFGCVKIIDPIRRFYDRADVRKDDAKFIAESRELVPKMRKALEAVLELVNPRACADCSDIRDAINRELGGDQ